MVRMFLIYYDNGESYEDHDTTNLCVVPTEARAKELIEKWEKWVEKSISNRPPSPYPSDTLTDEDYTKIWKAREGYLKSLRPPHGFVELAMMVGTPYEDSEGSLHYMRIKALS